MRHVSWLVATVLAFAVVARDYAVAGDSNAMRAMTYLLVIVVGTALVMRSDGLVTFSALALVGHYAVSLWLGHVDIDYAAPVLAATVVAYLDVADLALALPGDRHIDRGFAVATARRFVTVLGVAALGGALVLAVAALPLPSSPLVRALGLLGVAAAALAPLSVVRRQ